MPKTNNTTYNDLVAKTQGFTTIQQYARVLKMYDEAREENGIFTKMRSYLITNILDLRVDLQDSITCLYNRGSQVEVLYYRQVENKQDHIADTTQGQDSAGRHPSEHKYLSYNNNTTGYSSKAKWLEIGTKSNMVLTFEDRAYKIPTTKWADLMELLEFKVDHKKGGKRVYKITATKKNYKTVHQFMKGKYKTLDLTV